MENPLQPLDDICTVVTREEWHRHGRELKVIEHQFKDGKCVVCNMRKREAVNDLKEWEECRPGWDYDEFCDGDPTSLTHHFAEKLTGVKCLYCDRFIGNHE